MSGYTENNETRIPEPLSEYVSDTASPCDRLGLPTVNDFTVTLYTDYPNGAPTRQRFGLPVASGKYWGRVTQYRMPRTRQSVPVCQTQR